MRKECSKCKKTKNLASFNKNIRGTHGVHHYCKSCLRENKNRAYDYAKSKKAAMYSRYSLSMEDLSDLYTKQNGCCAICENKFPIELLSKRRGLHVDHCHSTGKVRELLCNRCNSTLGKVSESLDLLNKFKAYIIKHS